MCSCTFEMPIMSPKGDASINVCKLRHGTILPPPVEVSVEVQPLRRKSVTCACARLAGQGGAARVRG